MEEKNKQEGKQEKKDNYLLRLKKKLSDRHIYSIFVVILAVIIGIAAYMYKQKLNYESYLQNTFQSSFYEGAKYIDDVDNLLAKIKITNKPNQRVRIFTDLYREAASAQSNISRLPYNQSIMAVVLKYLTQLSDFSYAMLIKSADNQDLTPEEINSMNNLAQYATVLSTKMSQIKQDISDGNRINWDEIQKEGEANLQDVGNANMKALTGSISGVQKDFQNYPSLIYDGPFSEHIQKMEPEFIKNKEYIRKEVAIEIAKDFVGRDKIASIDMIYVTSTKQPHVIPVYRFGIKTAGDKNYSTILDITQQGGKPLWMLNYRQIPMTNAKLDMNTLANKTRDFLNKMGYPNMEVNYYEIVDSAVVFNFAYVQNGVTIYPDLIKVKTSLINGDIVGFESMGYIMTHKERVLPTPKITPEAAKGEVNKTFQIERVKLTLIPLDSKKEVLCYELKGKNEGKDFLVYVNAVTAKHEKILELIKNQNGVFTQ
ncbi:MAG: germination protein YpeB [Clostridiales bacterium GWE2_32_10]|nr:MAG: germination protein YpeB [Clostridiales bacterium GWE2_32_10]HBY21057.1 germination protein YpeB [Clostridiales bacterium]